MNYYHIQREEDEIMSNLEFHLNCLTSQTWKWTGIQSNENDILSLFAYVIEKNEKKSEKGIFSLNFKILRMRKSTGF